MAVDAKEVLQRNKVLIACYVAALVPVVLWGVLVVNGVKGGSDKTSYNRTAQTLNQRVRTLAEMARNAEETAKGTAPAPLYTPAHKRAFEERNNVLKQQYNDMIGVVKQRDNAIERWFSPWDKEPTPGDLDGRLKSEQERLKKEYGDLVLSPDKQTVYLWTETSIPQGTQKKVQKKFWIQEAILRAIKKGAAERLLAAVEFPPPVQGLPPAPGQENKKPLVEAIPARVTVAATFRDLPKIIRELAAQDVVFRIMKVRTELLEFSIVKKESDGFTPPLIVNPERLPLYSETIYSGFLADKTKIPTNEEDVLPEPKLKVSIDVEAVDFDVDSIAPPQAAAPAEAPPAEAPPPEKPKKAKKKEDE